MTDDQTPSGLEDLDAPRPIPAALRNRLEAGLLDAVLTEALAGADAPRPLPDALRDRLEGALLAGDGPRIMPSSLRGRLEHSLRAGVQGTRVWTRPVAIAAAVLLVLGSAALITRNNSNQRRPLVAGPPLASTTTAGSAASEFNAQQGVGGAAVQVPGAPTGDAARSATAGAGASSGRKAAAATGSAYPPPPFAYAATPAASSALSPSASGGSGATTSTSPPVQATLRIGIVGGDSLEEKAFRGYVTALNQNGGAGGHRFEVVGAGTSGTVATVNLSAAPVSPPSGRALIEALSAPESELQGDVFDAASVAERQAHIAAASAFPESAPGARAVIFVNGAEPFATRVPGAIETVLRARGVASVRVDYDPSMASVLPDVDAAFLSMDTAAAGSWLRAAGAGYAPPRGTWGVYSLADESLLGAMKASVRVVSPFSFPGDDEASAIRNATGAPLSSRSIHGWLSAKLLAVAVWKENANSAQTVATALSHLRGYEDGFAPPYEERAGTHSRLPEGIVLRPNGASFAADAGFVRDTF